MYGYKRSVNHQIYFDPFPIPETAIHALSSTGYFGKIDIKYSYDKIQTLKKLRPFNLKYVYSHRYRLKKQVLFFNEQ